MRSWLDYPAGTKGELRNFARTLVLLSLCDALVLDLARKGVLLDALALHRTTLTTVVKSIGTARREHPLPDPPPISSNPFFTLHGTYGTSLGPRPTNANVYRKHDPVVATVQHPTEAPKRGTKTKEGIS